MSKFLHDNDDDADADDARAITIPELKMAKSRNNKIELS